VISPATASLSVGRTLDCESLFPGALAVEDVAVALDEDLAVREHVGELPDLLRIFDRLVERIGEIVGSREWPGWYCRI
jgi:hypothetical protein